jgi:citrate lyase gamma subunit
MALSAEEKSELRHYICETYHGIGLGLRLTPEVLASFAAKTDDEIREILSAYKANKLQVLADQKAKLDAAMAALQS